MLDQLTIYNTKLVLGKGDRIIKLACGNVKQNRLFPGKNHQTPSWWSHI